LLDIRVSMVIQDGLNLQHEGVVSGLRSISCENQVSHLFTDIKVTNGLKSSNQSTYVLHWPQTL
jgi:hypothetical protein